ncbi:hypothetical protein GF357_00395 [Candidatus Dojkabacteria bacterium]|nr:hypothetical protein [Candidatus Dojkabacteria bacterium]
MRKIEEWKDTYYGATNTIYSFPNEVRLLHTKRPGTKECCMHVVLQGGGYYEEQLGVPYGTAHFLEHLLNKPNKKFKTNSEIDDFLLGDRKKARVYRNAFTSVGYMTYEGWGHSSTLSRMSEFLVSQFNYPFERTSEFMDNLRHVIISECRQLPKEDRNANLQIDKFLNGSEYKEFTKPVIGDVNSIKSITQEHIKFYWDNVFSTENTIITVQNDKELGKKVIENVEKIATMARKPNKDLKIQQYELKNEFKFSHFRENNAQNIILLLAYYIEKSLVKRYTKNLYTKFVLLRFTRNLINHLVFSKLREEKGLLYSGKAFTDTLNWHWNIGGLNLKCNVENLEDLLEEIYQLLNVGLVEYLKQSEGKRWLESEISNYIFPINVDFNSSYSESLGRSIIFKYLPYKYDFDYARYLIRKLTVEKMIDFVEESIVGLQPHIWVSSPYPEWRIKRVVFASKFGS